MPVGKLTRRSSNETLDSTLDSRMSSSDIPKMELLKINYVHQCKEALMPRSAELLPPRLPQRMSSSTGVYNFSPYTKTVAPEAAQNGHVTKVMLGMSKTKAAQVPPPPTVESWNFLHKTDNSSSTPSSPTTPTTPTMPKFVVQERPLEDSDENEQTDLISCCNSACLSSSSESEQSSSTDTIKPPTTYAEVSKSWDYRAQVSVRAGVKSRADRIAHIERTECDHLHRSSKTNLDMVSRINQLFESCGAKPRTTVHKVPQQPMRAAPMPIKEPNMRRRPYSVTPTEMEQQRRLNDNSSACSCNLDIEDAKKKSGSLDNRSKLVSRIPKPINDRRQRPCTVFTESSDHLQRRINDVFEQGTQQNRKLRLHTDAKSKMKASKSIDGLAGIARESEPQLSDFDHKLLRNACQSYGGDNHKMKVERIHIRKKRQPLLIINQLNADETTAKPTNTEVQTCGYKNCNLRNCPVSSHEQDQQQAEDIMKRLSLESCSDSGISSTQDTHEQSIKADSLKNLEKCSDCVNILENQHTKAAEESEHKCVYAEIIKDKSKDKEIEHMDGQQIKIHVRKPQVDLNDVQYLSNKNLTKMTTDEILNTTTKSKQCNIDNDMRNMEQRKSNHSLQATTIHIDDDWVKESADTLNEFMDSELVKRRPEAVKPHGKPINCSDNAVKIFVRSSSSTGATANSSRASSVSAMSYASQTSGISSASSISSAASSICECHDKCYQPSEGLFINRHQVAQKPQIPPRRRPKDVRFLPPITPLSPTLSSASTTSSFALSTANPSNIGGVFWNNNYFCTQPDLVTDAINDQCCCDCLSSCEDDNCSCYEIECETATILETPPPPPPRTRGRNLYLTTKSDGVAIKKPQASKKSHNNHIEELLLRKSKLLRKVSLSRLIRMTTYYYVHL